MMRSVVGGGFWHIQVVNTAVISGTALIGTDIQDPAESVETLYS